MKFLFRWAFRLLILLVVLVVAGILLLDTLAREAIIYQIRNQTGLETKIGSVNVGLLHPEITIENLVIYNNAGFGGAPFIELPELHIDYDRDALWSRKFHCQLIRLNLARFNIVEDEKGRRNFDVQKVLNPVPSAAPNQPRSIKISSRKFIFTGVDTLNLTLGKATYQQLKNPEHVDEIDLNIKHQVFNNIKSTQDLSAVLIVAALRSGANLMQSGHGQSWLQLLEPPAK